MVRVFSTYAWGPVSGGLNSSFRRFFQSACPGGGGPKSLFMNLFPVLSQKSALWPQGDFIQMQLPIVRAGQCSLTDSDPSSATEYFTCLPNIRLIPPIAPRLRRTERRPEEGSEAVRVQGGGPRVQELSR